MTGNQCVPMNIPQPISTIMGGIIRYAEIVKVKRRFDRVIGVTTINIPFST